MQPPNGYTTEPADLQTATDAEVVEIAQFRQELAVEERPEDPPTPLKVIEQWLRARPPGQWRAILVARDSSGGLDCYGVAARNLKDNLNGHIRWVLIVVQTQSPRGWPRLALILLGLPA